MMAKNNTVSTGAGICAADNDADALQVKNRSVN